MSSFLGALPSESTIFMKSLSEDHDVEVSQIIGGLHDWVFSIPRYKNQFEVWLGTVYPLKGQTEETHEDRYYIKDSQLTLIKPKRTQIENSSRKDFYILEFKHRKNILHARKS